jgi:hypothetical protein
VAIPLHEYSALLNALQKNRGFVGRRVVVDFACDRLALVAPGYKPVVLAERTEIEDNLWDVIVGRLESDMVLSATYCPKCEADWETSAALEEHQIVARIREKAGLSHLPTERELPSTRFRINYNWSPDHL